MLQLLGSELYPWMQTFSGDKFFYGKVDHEVKIEDLANHLAKICRFGGAVKEFYSVAQHSVIVSFLSDKNCALYALLHDGHEAFTSDIPRPAKMHINNIAGFDVISVLQDECDRIIFESFGLVYPMPEGVKQHIKKIDNMILATERRDLVQHELVDWEDNETPHTDKIKPLSWCESRDLFLSTYYELINDK